MTGHRLNKTPRYRVARPFALVKFKGALTLAEVRSIHAEGGGFISGPITGYRILPLTNEGVYQEAPVAKDDIGYWIKPIDLFKDWAIRPSAANLEKAIDAARQDIFA